VEPKKEEFKKYLEKTGTVDQLTKILVQLYEEPEKPGNAVEYLKRMLGGGGESDGLKLKQEYEAAKLENERLKQQVKQFKEEVASYLPRSKRRRTSECLSDPPPPA
jgi:cell division protein FtsB